MKIDLDSVNDLVTEQDVEGFIADGAPADEYDTEAEELFKAIQHFATKELVSTRLMPILKRIWAVNFNVSGDELVSRQAGRRVGLTDDAREPHGDQPQKFVAGGMTEPVVDLFEAVEVDV